MIQGAQQTIIGHQNMLKNYEKNMKLNLKQLIIYQNADVSKTKNQITIIGKMVYNKLQLTESRLYDPKALKTDLNDLKTIEKQLKDIGISANLADDITLSKTKYYFDYLIRDLVV